MADSDRAEAQVMWLSKDRKNPPQGAWNPNDPALSWLRLGL